MMKAFLLDLDGVFYQGEQPVAHAADVTHWLQKKSIPHLYVTNTTSRSRQDLVEKLQRFGIYTDTDHLLTPPVAARHWLQQQEISKGVALYTPDKIKPEFSGIDLWQHSSDLPQAIVIGDLAQQWSYQVLNEIFRMLMQTPPPPLIALGMTRYWQAEDGLRLDVAPFVKALEHASGAEAIVLGKPAAPFFQIALDKLGFSANEVVMVGDDIRGDIEGAQQAGLKAWLVKTGKYRETDLMSGTVPDEVIPSVYDVMSLWHENQTG